MNYIEALRKAQDHSRRPRKVSPHLQKRSEALARIWGDPLKRDKEMTESIQRKKAR